MPKQKRGKHMLKLSIKIHPSILASFLFIFALLTLSGCTTTQSLSQQSDPSLSAQDKETYQLAVSALKAGKSKQAETILKKLIQSRPDFVNAYLNLGIISQENEQLDQAENYLSHVLKSYPENIIALNQLGIVQRKKGNFPRSKELYEKALSIEPDYANAHLNIGILYDLYFYDFQNAIKHYRIYQGLTKESDETVEKWIVDLERQFNKQVATK